MSLIFATQLTAVATAVLAGFAIITAIVAGLAFRKQSQEVSAIEQQVKDARDLASKQADLLQIQSGQLDLQRQQLEDQRNANARQAEILGLQATELRESLQDRKREAAERRQSQAARVLLTETRHPYISNPSVITGGVARVTAAITNGSGAPIYDTELRWHLGSAPHGDPNPQPVGTIMPHSEKTKDRVFPNNASLSECGAVATFRDAAGIKWMRKADGELMEQASG
jgi:hypothetical protein